MKNIALIIFIASLTSCGFYKRQYTSGWMFTHKHILHSPSAKSDAQPQNILAEMDNDVPLVAQNSFVIDTIIPENKPVPKTIVDPEKKEEEQDFYAPKDGYSRNDQNTNDRYSDELAKKTFNKRVQKQTEV